MIFESETFTFANEIETKQTIFNRVRTQTWLLAVDFDSVWTADN